MQLKKLELYGFKSFSDKTVIEFDKGITGIVGPNGCGKSNIVDSVMWVLGEQSVKNLRGSRMDDVVFKGSDKRKPNGFAEVSITFDNSDGTLPISYNEVLISRRLYRSGESLYKINGSECRLKDITSLFLDSGIGKYGYSIIGQGRVSEMLNATPEGRRYIFDEAAGIMKYKTRKEESEKHLFLTNENLSRANDLIYEIESHLPSLKIAAEKAEKYLGVAAVLKNCETTRFVLLNKRYKEREEKVGKQIELFDNDILQNENAKAQSQEKLESVTLRYGQVSDQCEKLRANRVESVRQSERLKGEYKYVCDKLQQLSHDEKLNAENISKYSVEAGAAEEQITSETKRNDDAKKEYDEILQKTENKEIAVNKLRHAYNEVAQALTNARQTQQNCIAQENAASLKLTQLSTKLEMLHNLADGDDTNAKVFEEKLNEAELLYNAANAEIKKLEEELNIAKNNSKKASDEYNSICDEYSQIVANTDKKAKFAESTKARLATLNEMRESMESFNNSTKAVMRLKNANKVFSGDILGTVSDIIRVEKKFETAIEVSLGGAVQNIVTKTDTSAKEIIEYLRQNRLGYATFLPLNSVQGRRISENDLRNIRQKGFLGVAVDLIKYDAMYSNVAENLLGRIVIAENMDCAINIARACRYMFRIVTLDGDVINPYGSISGGSRGKSNISNVFSRSREIDELETALKTDIEELKILNAQAVLCRQKRDTLQEVLSQAQEKEHDAVVNFSTAKRGYEYAESELKKAKQSKAQSDVKQSNVKEEIEKLEKEAGTLQISVEDCKIRLVKANSLLEELTLKEASSKQKLTEEDMCLTELKLKMIECESKVKVIKASLEDLVLRKNERISQISLLKRENENIREEISKCTANIHSLEKQIADCNEAEKNEVKILGECEADLKSLEKLKSALEEELRLCETLLYEINAKKHDFEMEKTKIIMESDNLQSRMWEVYQVSLGDALSAELVEGDIESLNKNIRELKTEITRMGAINPEAPQQYGEQSEKYKILCAERDDLIAASNDIKKLISQITSEMRVRFDEEFKIINEYFTEMFKILFNGGTARLELCNSDDILEAGIDIIAQPPGKRLQNISLMSGGEKALIATALLFALLKRRPAPFCILDEIDTALDEKNVYSLADLIKTFDEKIQFIIISHRKGTMEASNALYGVSMAEKGVSSLVSVRLEDAAAADQ